MTISTHHEQAGVGPLAVAKYGSTSSFEADHRFAVDGCRYVVQLQVTDNSEAGILFEQLFAGHREEPHGLCALQKRHCVSHSARRDAAIVLGNHDGLEIHWPRDLVRQEQHRAAATEHQVLRHGLRRDILPRRVLPTRRRVPAAGKHFPSDRE